jgi:hypothetical protein
MRIRNPDGDEKPIFINVDEMRARSKRVRPKVIGIVMELLGYGGFGPFVWEPVTIARWLTKQSGGEVISATRLRGMANDLHLFFTELPDGRWVPSHEVFSAIDGNPGRAS